MLAPADALATFLRFPDDPDAAEALSALDSGPLFEVSLDRADAQTLRDVAGKLRPGAPLLVGIDTAGRTPPGFGDLFDVMLTTAVSPPAPWVDVAGWGMDQTLAAMRAVARHCPVAAGLCAAVLRIGERLPFRDAIAVESLAYSTLLAGSEFRAWRGANPPRQRPRENGPLVRIERLADHLTITLARPAARNAVCARLRDDLVAALRFALLDESLSEIELRGDGPSFCAGGDLDEFGTAGDLARAHLIRTERSPAVLADQLAGRLTAVVHGAAVGGGIEIAAAAARVRASPGAMFRLPEVTMGLIPGSGGTASVGRRIGRHRAAFMALSGFDIDVGTALAWGLVDRVDAGP